jgi:hypothetical protein
MNLSRGMEPSKLERAKIKPDFSSITDQSIGRTYVIPRFFLDVMKRKYRFNCNLIGPSSKNFFLNMKSSSVGRVSILSCITAALVNSREKTLEHLTHLLGEGIHYFSDAYNLGRRYKMYLSGIEDIHLGKLSIVHDPEGKERVIAMLDY